MPPPCPPKPGSHCARVAKIHQYKRHRENDGAEIEIRRIPEKGRPRLPYNYISLWIKFLLFSANFFFWLSGTVIAGLGFWIQIEKNKEIRDFFDLVFDPSALLCVAGCIIFTLAFFGCLGALRENTCLLKTYHILLTGILLLELIAVIVVIVFYYVPSAREAILWGPEQSMKEAVVRYRDDEDLRNVIDTMQREFECCGVSNNDEGYKDWQENVYFNCSETNPSVERCGVPSSCCKTQMGEMVNVMCGYESTNKEAITVSDKIFTQGCLKGFGTWLGRNTIIAGASSLAIMLVQIFGICLSRILADQINQQKAQWKYQTAN